MIQEALARPIEITDTPVITVGATAVNIDEGVYASLFTAMAAIETAGITAGVITSVRLDANNYVVVDPVGSNTITWGSFNWAKFGFKSAGYGSAASHTAELVSPFIWLPSYYNNNIDSWHEKTTNFVGSMAVDGNNQGFEIGPRIDARTMRWDFEPNTSVYPEFCTDSQTAGYFNPWTIEQAGTYVNFIRETRTVQTTDTASSNISAKGLYYIPDLSDVAGPNVDTHTMDSGGISFNLSSGADTYVFCAYDSDRIERLANSFSAARERYNIMCNLRQATAPIWLVDGDQ
jgi:hypothetical protein